MTLPASSAVTSSLGLGDGNTPSSSLVGQLSLFGPALVPASPSVPRVSRKAKRTKDISGPSFDASSPSAVLQSSLGSKSLARPAVSGSEVSRACRVCGTHKPLLEFYKDKDSSGGYRQVCKVCCREQEAARKARTPKSERSQKHKAWRRENRAKALLALARHRAKKKGMEFTLIEADISGAMDAGVCELTGIPLNFDNGKTWDSPSLDRIDSGLGYTQRNVRVVLYCLNVMANVWGENKIIEIADAIMEARREKSLSLQTRLESSLRSQIDTDVSPEYVLTWKSWVMRSGPPICALRARGRPTSGNGCTGWPTPHLNSTTGPGTQGRKGGLNLQTAATLAGWPTPISNDALGSTHCYGPKKDGQERARYLKLPGAAQLTGAINGTSASTAKHGALNPAFSRWLMGYPPVWDDSAPMGTRLSRKSQPRS